MRTVTPNQLLTCSFFRRKKWPSFCYHDQNQLDTLHSPALTRSLPMEKMGGEGETKGFPSIFLGFSSSFVACCFVVSFSKAGPTSYEWGYKLWLHKWACKRRVTGIIRYYKPKRSFINFILWLQSAVFPASLPRWEAPRLKGCRSWSSQGCGWVKGLSTAMSLPLPLQWPFAS